MSRLEVGGWYVIAEFENGDQTIARIVRSKGLFFKRYLASISGVDACGYHKWPTGTPSYMNWLTREDIKNARKRNV